MKIFKSRKAYFIRLFVTIVSVFTMIAVLASSYIIFSNNKAIKKERDVLNLSRIATFKQNTDMQINMAVAQIENYRNDTIFAQYALNSYSGEAMEAKIYERLSSNQFLFANIGVSLGVINPRTGQCIMSDGYNKIDISELDIKFNELPLINYTLVSDNGIIPMRDGRNEDGAVFVINQKYAGDSSLVFVFVLYNINNFSVVDMDNYAMVYSNSVAFTSNELEFPENIIDITDDTVKTGKNDIYMQHSDVLPQIRYFYYTNAVGSAIGIQSFIILALLLALSISVAMIIVIRLYAPIDKAVTGFNVINNQEYHDEIEHMTQTANKMYADITRLRESSREQMGLLANKFIHDLCLGTITNDEAERIAEKYSLNILRESHAVINIEIIDLGPELSDINSYIYRNIKHDIIEMFVNDVIQNAQYYIVEPSNSRAAFIINGDVNEYKVRINELFNKIELQYGIDVIAAIGTQALDYTQTERSYLSTVNLLDNHIFSGDSYVAMPEDIVGDSELDMYYPFEVEEKIIEDMVAGRYEAATGLLDKVFEINIENGMTAQKWTELKFLIMSTINRILTKIDKTADNVFGEDVILYLELSGKRNEDIQNRMKVIFCKLGEFIENNSREGSEQLADIIEFIDNNIDKDISLMDLAQHLDLTPSYVSRLFKNIVKQNFKVYTNQRRVEIAKRILREEKNIKISELAIRVGCNNSVTFTRIFKKYTGMTPSEFI